MRTKIVCAAVLLPRLDASFIGNTRLFGRPRACGIVNSLDSETPTQESSPPPQATAVIGVVAPLLYRGPYPCLGLNFPNLANETSDDGTTLHFVLDTGANVNTLDSRIVDKFQLPVAYTAQELNILGRAGVGGTFDSSDQALYRLGDCRLSGMPAEFSKVTFMTNLTVASLPFPGPTGAGLLGLPFFGSFSGVEFDWHGTDGDPPTMVFFFYDVPDLAKNNTKRLEIDMSLLVPALDISVNGVELRAILDTGSPLTIFSEEAARITGVAVVDSEDLVDPLAIDSAPRRESLGDDVLTIGGVDGNHLSLHKSKSCTIKIQSGDVSFGSGSVYVGNLPLFSMMESQQFPFNSSNSSRPSIILGLDALRRTYRMILRISSGEVWLEELSGQI